MKLGLFSDIHFTNWTAFAKVNPDGINSRLQHTSDRAGDIIRIAEAEGCAALLFAGDWFHTKTVAAEVIDMAVRSFAKANIPIIGVPGNHDMATFGGNARHSARAMGGKVRWLDDFEGRTAELSVGNEDLLVYGIPYMPKHEDLLAEMKAAPKCGVMLMHAGFAGSFMGSDYIADMGDCPDYAYALEAKAKLIVSGHFHQPQLITIAENLDVDIKKPSGHNQIGKIIPGRTILVPGSPEQHTWGDMGSHHGFWIIDTVKNEAEFHKLDSPEFVEIGADQKCATFDAKNYYRFTGGVSDEAMETYKKFTPNFIVEHAPAPATRPARAFEANIADAPNTLVQKFVESAETKLDKKRLVDAGLRFLGC